jgi:hypothetical protein
LEESAICQRVGNVFPALSDVGHGDYGATEEDALAAKSFSNVVNGATSRVAHPHRLHTSLQRKSPRLGNCRACHPQSRADARHMTDLLQVLPDFDAKPYTHLLPSLDKALITTNDLLTLEAADVAKRAQLPAGELRRLADAVIQALHQQLGFGGEEDVGNHFLTASGNPDTEKDGWTCISTLDEKLDAALGGGIPRGYLVEVTGERYDYSVPVMMNSCTAS